MIWLCDSCENNDHTDHVRSMDMGPQDGIYFCVCETCEPEWYNDVLGEL